MGNLEKKLIRDKFQCELAQWVRETAERRGSHYADACLDAMAGVLAGYGYGASYHQQDAVRQFFGFDNK